MAPYGFPKSVVTPAQQKTRQVMLDLMESFAKCGKPGVQGQEGLWTPLEEGKGEYLDVGEKLAMTRESNLASQLSFWKSILERARAASPGLSPDLPTVYHAKIAHKRYSAGIKP